MELSDLTGVELLFVRDLEQGKPDLMTGKINQVLLFFVHNLEPVPITKDNFYERLDDDFIKHEKKFPPFDYMNKISSVFANRNMDEAKMKLRKFDKHKKKV